MIKLIFELAFIQKLLKLLKLIFELAFILFIHFIEKLIQLIDKNYRIELMGFD